MYAVCSSLHQVLRSLQQCYKSQWEGRKARDDGGTGEGGDLEDRQGISIEKGLKKIKEFN